MFFSVICLFSSNQTSGLVGFIIIFSVRKAARVSSLVLSRLCITTLKPCHWVISSDIKVTLTCIIQSHSFLTPTAQAAGQLWGCTVDIHATFSIYTCGSELYLSIFLHIGSISLYICMCCCFFFLVSKCPPYLYCIYADSVNFKFLDLLFILYVMAYLHTYLSSSPHQFIL